MQAQESGDDELAAELEPEYQRLRGLLSRNMVLFNQARKAAKESQEEHIAAGGEFLVDGTGGNYNEIANQVEKLESAGYDVAMIFIDVPMETSVERDFARGERGGRRLGKRTVEKSHAAVSANRPLYEELFGDDFFYVENSGDNFESSIEDIVPGVARFLG
jgi:predicted ABC-type ATPase